MTHSASPSLPNESATSHTAATPSSDTVAILLLPPTAPGATLSSLTSPLLLPLSSTLAPLSRSMTRTRPLPPPVAYAMPPSHRPAALCAPGKAPGRERSVMGVVGGREGASESACASAREMDRC